MPCYRSGGCGPYEGLPCGECPASKPDYPNHGDAKELKSLASSLGLLQARLEGLIDGKSWKGQDADTVLADYVGIQGSTEFGPSARKLCEAVAASDQPQHLAAAFSAITGRELADYFRSAIDVVRREVELLEQERANAKRTLSVTVQCMCTYPALIEVPKDFDIDQAVRYAKEHLAEIPVGPLTHVPDSDQVDEESALFLTPQPSDGLS